MTPTSTTISLGLMGAAVIWYQGDIHDVQALDHWGYQWDTMNETRERLGMLG